MGLRAKAVPELSGSGFDGEARKGPTEAVTELLQERIAEGEAGAVYRSYSAIAHGTIFGLMQLLVPTKERWQGEAVNELSLDPRMIEASLGTALVGFIEFFDRLVTLMGWNEWAWAGWHDQLVEVVNRSLAAY